MAGWTDWRSRRIPNWLTVPGLAVGILANSIIFRWAGCKSALLGAGLGLLVLLPFVMINSEARYPWPLGIMQYQGQYGTDWGKVLAFVSLTLTPAVIFYLMAQKHIIAGLTSGAVKG